MKQLLCIVFFFCSGYGLPYAQTIVAIRDSVSEHQFTSNDQVYLEDPDNRYTIGQVSTVLYDQFVLNYLYAPHNENTESTYWVRIRIRENSQSEKKWLLEFFDQTTDLIEVYIPDQTGYFQKVVMGENYPFHQRKFQHKNFEVSLSNQTNKVQEYYIRVRSYNSVNIIVVLRSYEKFIYYALNEYLLFGLFYGMILVVSIYNLLMFFAIREKEYLVYILYILSVGLYISCSDGIAFQYLWPDHPEWNNMAYGVALYSVILWSMIFTKLFLHTTLYPGLNRIINAVIIIRTSIFLVAMFYYPKLFELRWIEFLPVSIVFFSGLYVYRKGFKAARFFSLAYGLLFIAFLVKISINLDLGIIDGSILTNYSVSISFWCEMILLTFALGDKVRIIKDSKDKALREIILQHEVNQQLNNKVNRELEGEVQKRTQEIIHQKEIIEQQFNELKVANQKLVAQSEEIQKINALLDIDNYKLQRTINEEMLARVGRKNMEYEEFKKIFPDELTCMRFLERKWEEGFSCRKCKNDKFLPGKSKFDRRCSRCGYNESPMAFTLFHGVKFPIEKAFYILHLVIAERNDLTIDEISQILDLRRNTAWNFRNKVSKILKGNKRGKAVNWETIIFFPEGETPEQVSIL
jgi:two-component system, sensor histidine kinase LadS